MSTPTPQPPHQPLIARRFAHLTMPIVPFLSTTTNTPHPAYPLTLLSYHLLTEPELDSLATHYHQSSPKRESWTYPATVAHRWGTTTTTTTTTNASLPPTHPHHRTLHRRARRRKAATHLWTKTTPLDPNPKSTTTSTTPNPNLNPNSTTTSTTTTIPAPTPDPTLTESKRRRFGRFIGLSGCESPGMTAETSFREMAEAMERWVEEEVERRVVRDRGVEEGWRKGGW